MKWTKILLQTTLLLLVVSQFSLQTNHFQNLITNLVYPMYEGYVKVWIYKQCNNKGFALPQLRKLVKVDVKSANWSEYEKNIKFELVQRLTMLKSEFQKIPEEQKSVLQQMNNSPWTDMPAQMKLDQLIKFCFEKTNIAKAVESWTKSFSQIDAKIDEKFCKEASDALAHTSNSNSTAKQGLNNTNYGREANNLAWLGENFSMIIWGSVGVATIVFLILLFVLLSKSSTRQRQSTEREAFSASLVESPTLEAGSTSPVVSSRRGAHAPAPPKGKPGSKAPPKGKPSAKAPLKDEPGPKAPAKGKPNTKAQPKDKPGPKAPPKDEPDSKAQPKNKPDPKAPPKDKPGPIAQPKDKPDQKAQPKDKPGPKDEPDPKAQPKDKPDPIAQPKDKPDPKAQPKDKPGPKDEPDPKAQPKDKPGPKDEPNPKAQPKGKPSTKPPQKDKPGSKAPPKLEPGSKVPPKDESGSKAPPKDESGSKAPPKDESGSKAPPKDESGSKAPPKDESGSKAPPKDESVSKAPTKNESDSKVSTKDESDSKAVSKDESGSKAPAKGDPL